MKKINIKLFTIITLSVINSFGQTKNTNAMKNEKSNNPLLCDPKEGFCEIPTNQQESSPTISKTEKTIKVIYFTDPICSSCWGIETQLRKLKLEYGDSVEVTYHMGGLLPNWSYNSGGISKPTDVASHWDEASLYYDMPIDGNVWIEDPLHSSYPPSIAFKAAQMQDEEKAKAFMRELREMVFLKKINIAKEENIIKAAQNVELNIEQLKNDLSNNAMKLFEEDLKLARQFGVRGFPTLYFINKSGFTEVVYGSKPYTFYENAIQKLDSNIKKESYAKNVVDLMNTFHSLTAREFSELSGTPRMESEKILNDLVTEGKLEKFTTRNGSIWKLLTK